MAKLGLVFLFLSQVGEAIDMAIPDFTGICKVGVVYVPNSRSQFFFLFPRCSEPPGGVGRRMLGWMLG